MQVAPFSTKENIDFPNISFGNKLTHLWTSERFWLFNYHMKAFYNLPFHVTQPLFHQPRKYAFRTWTSTWLLGQPIKSKMKGKEEDPCLIKPNLSSQRPLFQIYTCIWFVVYCFINKWFIKSLIYQHPWLITLHGAYKNFSSKIHAALDPYESQT